MSNDALTAFLTGSARKNGDKINLMNQIEIPLYLWVMQLANRRYKWKNVPKEIPNYRIENGMFVYGTMVFFELAGNKFMMPSAMSEGMNAYNQMTKVRPYGFNGTYFPEVNVEPVISPDGKMTDEPNAVLVRNNELELPTLFLVRPYIERVAYIWQSLGIDEAMSRTLGMIYTNDKRTAGMVQTQLEALFDKKSPFAVMGDKKFTNVKNGGMLDQFQWDVKYDPKTRWASYYNTMSQLFTVLGITNSSQNDKKERNTIAEVNKNDIVTQLSGDIGLELRQEAVDKINEMFKLNIQVEEQEVSIDYEQASKDLVGGNGQSEKDPSNPSPKKAPPTPSKGKGK